MKDIENWVKVNVIILKKTHTIPKLGKVGYF